MNVLAPVLDAIPTAMRAEKRWLLWRLLERNGKPTKVPFTSTGDPASSTDPTTWTTFETVTRTLAKGGFDGIGFALGDGFTGVDLDKCRDPLTGALESWASSILDEVRSYAEISVSGRGVHIIARGRLPEGGRKRGRLELYDGGRYFTVSGRLLDEDSPRDVEPCDAALAMLHARFFPPAQTEAPALSRPTEPLSFDDEEILKRAFAAKNGTAVEKLFRGEWEKDYPSQSEADLALVSMLAFWSEDAAQLDRLYARSGLFRDKWNEKHFATGETYGARTIAKALLGRDHYSPHGVNSEHKERSSVIQKRNEPGVALPDDAPIQLEEFPAPPSRAAFHGPLGELVAKLEPHTEADPVGLLVQALVGFGNVVGRTAHFEVEADRHFTNENAILVGQTGKGRKGTSWGRIRRVFETVDSAWAENRVLEGLSSGEGLIWNVRDPIEKVGKKGDKEEVDPGVTDKRLLLVEGEFARALQNLAREGNTLSSVIRSAWDTGTLRSLTKSSPAKATNAHISIVAHITKTELLKLLAQHEAANGFGNRFLWVCVRRSKCLPDGGSLRETDLAELVSRLATRVQAARRIHRMSRDAEASKLWHEVYPTLSEGRPGLLGAMTDRSEAHVLRLSLIYALSDGSEVVRREHLEAALELWAYVERSARFIFGQQLGDPIADTILAELRRLAPQGLTRTKIMADVLQGHTSAAEAKRALTGLHGAGLARREVAKTRGRSVETWFATSGTPAKEGERRQDAFCELSEQSEV